MKRKTIILAVLAFALAIGVSIAPASAYFTDRSTANGGLPISIEPTTDLKEKFGEKTKRLVVKNVDDSRTPVFVRAKVFTSLPSEIAGESWTGPDGDEWYNYDDIVNPGEETKELTVKVTFPTVKSETEPDGAVYGDEHSVIVVYESTPVQYDADGNPFADWSYVLYTGTSEREG